MNGCNSYGFANLYPTNVGAYYDPKDAKDKSVTLPSYESVMAVDKYKEIAIKFAQKIKNVDANTIRSAFEREGKLESIILRIGKIIDNLGILMFLPTLVSFHASFIIAPPILITALTLMLCSVISIPTYFAVSLIGIAVLGAFLGLSAAFACTTAGLGLFSECVYWPAKERNDVRLMFEKAICNFKIAEAEAKQAGIDLSIDADYRQLKESLVVYPQYAELN